MQLDRRGPAARFQALLLGTGDDGAERIIAVRSEQDVVGFAVFRERDPKLRGAVGELHTIDVVAAGTDAAKEDRLDGTERIQHRLNLGSLTPHPPPPPPPPPILTPRPPLPLLPP